LSMRNSETTRGKILKSAVWTTGARLVGQGVTLITTLVLARLLVKEDFGLMAMTLTYSGFVDNFIDLGFLSAIIQAKEIKQKQLNACFWVLTAGAILVCSVSLAGSSLISRAFAEARVKSLIETLALSLLLIPIQIVCKGILSRELRIDTIAKVELVAGLVRAVSSVMLAFVGFGVWSLISGYMIEKVLLAVCYPVAARWYPRLSYDNDGIKQLFGFGANVTLGAVLWYIFNQADYLIIGRLLGAATLGIYSMANQIASGVYQFLAMTWNRVVYPVFSRYQKSDQLGAIFEKTSAFFALVTWPICIGLAATAPDIVRVLLGAKWEPAVAPLRMLAVVTGIRTVSGLVPTLLNSVGHPEENVKVNFFSCIVFSAAFYGAAKWMGLQGVLLAWIILYPIRYFVLLGIVFRYVRVPAMRYAKAHVGTMVSVVLMFFAVVFMTRITTTWNSPLRLTASILLGATIYFGLQVFLSRNLIGQFVAYAKGQAYPT
jgi:teichuronic acid exporter